MSKQTPLQEFIADILSGKVIDTLANQQYYLDKEKQMVIDAFNDGWENIGNAVADGEQYYNETYNNDTPNI